MSSRTCMTGVARRVLIIDDYDYWEGSRKAVDEFWPKSTPIATRPNRGDPGSRQAGHTFQLKAQTTERPRALRTS